MKRLRKILFGEPMPDSSDPRYRKLGQRAEKLGSRFAEWLKLDALFAKIQAFASRSPRVFLTLVFGIVLVMFARNVAFMVQYGKARRQQCTAIEMQDRMLHEHETVNKSR